MTPEEAIRVFEAWIERDKKMEYADRLENIEIYNMAIEALKTETKKCPVCGSDLHEYCFMCCYEGKKVKMNESDHL